MKSLQIILFLSLSTSYMYGQNSVANYLRTQNTLIFSDVSYELSWSAHPSDTYYKQEYIPKGENNDSYQDMILIDFLNQDTPILDIVKAQIVKILERKKKDAICNYQLVKNDNTNEYILDFLMSEGTNNKPNIIEWNAYRYKPCKDKFGHAGIILFGVSHREYGSKIDNFFKSFQDYRGQMLKNLRSYPIPEIELN